MSKTRLLRDGLVSWQSHIPQRVAAVKIPEHIVYPGNVDGGDIMRAGNHFYIAIDEFSDAFRSSEIIKLDQDECYSANCLRINDYLLIPNGFPKAKQKILELGYRIIEIKMSEFRKMDGSLTCLSLLF